MEDEVISQFFLQTGNFLLGFSYVFLALSEIYVQVVNQFLEAVFFAFKSIDGGLKYEKFLVFNTQAWFELLEFVLQLLGLLGRFVEFLSQIGFDVIQLTALEDELVVLWL